MCDKAQTALTPGRSFQCVCIRVQPEEATGILRPGEQGYNKDLIAVGVVVSGSDGPSLLASLDEQLRA